MLTETAIRAARPKEKAYKLNDGRGLVLLVNPNGARYWRFRFQFDGREQMLSLGTYPDTPLKRAREKLDECRRLVADGVNPCAKRMAERLAAEETFEAVAREWFAKQEPNWAKSHSSKVMDRMEADLFPWIGSRSIANITAPELLACLRRIEGRGAIDTAHRAHQNAGQVFRYAVATGRAPRDPSGDLRGALAPVKKGHFPSITEPERIGELLRAIDGYQGSLTVRCALKFAPLVFVRPGEMRAAEWSEIDIGKAEWRIKADRMKARVQHIVPLSQQALSVLEEVQPYSGDTRFVFPSERTWTRPMSENTVNAGLRRMGYSTDDMTAHGFRSMASTLLNEQGWNRDAIERQLAHGERDAVRAAYNYAQHLPERRKMMQAWADYLDTLRASGSGSKRRAA
jgi:integrase